MRCAHIAIACALQVLSKQSALSSGLRAGCTLAGLVPMGIAIVWT